MERPLCPLCKTKHYAREAHVFKASHPVIEETIQKLLEPLPAYKDIPEILKVAVAAPVEISHPPVKGFDRVGYQREYMRVWRAVKGGRACLWPSGGSHV